MAVLLVSRSLNFRLPHCQSGWAEPCGLTDRDKVPASLAAPHTARPLRVCHVDAHKKTALRRGVCALSSGLSNPSAVFCSSEATLVPAWAAVKRLSVRHLAVGFDGGVEVEVLVFGGFLQPAQFLDEFERVFAG